MILSWPTMGLSASSQPLFSITHPSLGPFPSNIFTVDDPTQQTGLRVNIPLPNCTKRVSDCEIVTAINTLDGFNVQPRLSIPFTGPIDVSTVTSETVFLVSLGSPLANQASAGPVVGINQVVWDPETNTLFAESDKLLQQYTRYALIVTNGVRNRGGAQPPRRAFQRFLKQLKRNAESKPYHRELQKAIKLVRKTTRLRKNQIAALSVFTTQSVTPILEKIRDQIKAATPEAANFLLGPERTRTAFPFHEVRAVMYRRHVGIRPHTFLTDSIFLEALDFIPNTVRSLAFGKYISPNYLTDGQFIPPFGTSLDAPPVQDTKELFFTLFLPSSEKPVNGYPVAIFGHFREGDKETAVFFAAHLAARGIATIAINAVGHGGGPLGTLEVKRFAGIPITFSAGGRGIDQNGDKVIDATEGVAAAPPQEIIGIRDGTRQTVVDLMQLVRVIEIGIDVDGDGIREIDPSQISYLGVSFGGIYGTLLLAVEPNVRVGVLNVPGGGANEVFRLSLEARAAIERTLASLIPPLTNVGDVGIDDLRFNENLPLRDALPVVNDVPGSLAIQEWLERAEWVCQAGNPVAYAPHLQKQPLLGVPPKAVIYQFARGDQNVVNPTTTAILRAGELAASTTFYRHDLAFHDPFYNPTGQDVLPDPHTFLFFNPSFAPMLVEIGFGAQQQIAQFFASDGAVVIDPDGPLPLFEVPIIAPLPEDCGFVQDVLGFTACR